MTDAKLTRWSFLLFVFAALSGLQAIVAPILLMVNGTPITLSHGSEIWSTTLQALSAVDGAMLVTAVMAPQLAWIYAMAQVALLALDYRRGLLFHSSLTKRFIRLGVAMFVASVLGSTAAPVLGQIFFARGVLPWVPDIPLFAAVDTSLAMAGVLFFVLGKVMQRGAELQDSDSLTI
ncbi:MAG: hypothetical protein LDL39_03610 [Magnetospirillum sp.]|nr:hypothetical protein [Magnetospirillum sp.]